MIDALGILRRASRFYTVEVDKKIKRYQALEMKIEDRYASGKPAAALEGKAARLLEEIESTISAIDEEGEGFTSSMDLQDPLETQFAHQYQACLHDPSMMPYLGKILQSIEGLEREDPEMLEQLAADAYVNRQNLIVRLRRDRGKRPTKHAKRWLDCFGRRKP